MHGLFWPRNEPITRIKVRQNQTSAVGSTVIKVAKKESLIDGLIE
jgi:hypothetical protein